MPLEAPVITSVRPSTVAAYPLPGPGNSHSGGYLSRRIQSAGTRPAGPGVGWSAGCECGGAS